MRGSTQEFIQNLEDLKGREHLEDLGVDGTMYHKGKVWEGIDWIHLAQDRVQWRAFVNTVMNLQVP
jgi:hypothetical protein